jgi:hypothetical protein
MVQEVIKDVDKNSMNFWYPLIKDLPIPQPRTVFYHIPKEDLYNCYRKGAIALNMPRVLLEAYKVGFPLFLRTDQASNKHFWNKAAFVRYDLDLFPCVDSTIEFNVCAGVIGLGFTSLVFREYIPMDSGYTAFYGEMPVNPERRYLIKDGKVVAHFPYWIKDAIENPSNPDWEKISDQMNIETPHEIRLLTGYASLVAGVLEGYWSVDFCKAKDGRWILIDLALGEQSYKPTNLIKEYG